MFGARGNWVRSTEYSYAVIKLVTFCKLAVKISSSRVNPSLVKSVLWQLGTCQAS